MSPLEDLIKSKHLTKTERLVADYILENSAAVCFMTATDLATKLQISDSSVIRTSRSLGFQGYKELLRCLQDDVTDSMQTSVRKAPHARLAAQFDILDEKEGRLYSDMLASSINNVNSTFEKNPEEKLLMAASLLMHANNKYIAGFRGVAGCAVCFGQFLSQILTNVHVESKADASAIEKMLDLTEDDCVVVMAFERYSAVSMAIADMAREKKCKLIVITDKLTSPIAFNADVVFVCSADNLTVFHSFIGPFFIIESLTTQIMHSTGLQVKNRLELMDRYVSSLGLF